MYIHTLILLKLLYYICKLIYQNNKFSVRTKPRNLKTELKLMYKKQLYICMGSPFLGFN